jgi:hypothetical protein
MRKVKSKVSPVHAMEVRGSRYVTPLVLNLGDRWRQVVYITPWLLYPWERTPVHIEFRKLVGKRVNIFGWQTRREETALRPASK